MIIAELPKIPEIAAVPSLSFSANCIPLDANICTGRRLRAPAELSYRQYFARRYMTVTMKVPSARLYGMFFLGLITSPAVKVMLFQASEENKDPTMAIPTAASNANPDKGKCFPLLTDSGFQRILLLRWMASEFMANPRPRMMKTSRSIVFPDVNAFCTFFPALIPLVFIQVRKTMERIATI